MYTIMERPVEERGPDTGKIELERIIDCLKENNYKFEKVEESDTYGCMVANFHKDIMYSDQEGNYINDRHIKIKIDFDSDFDYTKNYKNRDGDYVFNMFKGHRFIKNLFDNNNATSVNATSVNASGTKKRRIKRKKTTRRRYK